MNTFMDASFMKQILIGGEGIVLRGCRARWNCRNNLIQCRYRCNTFQHFARPPSDFSLCGMFCSEFHCLREHGLSKVARLRLHGRLLHVLRCRREFEKRFSRASFSGNRRRMGLEYRRQRSQIFRADFDVSSFGPATDISRHLFALAARKPADDRSAVKPNAAPTVGRDAADVDRVPATVEPLGDRRLVWPLEHQMQHLVLGQGEALAAVGRGLVVIHNL
jgi:hypothetical protein